MKGNRVLQSLLQEPKAKPEEYYKAFVTHICPTSQFRMARHHFSQLQQDKSEHVDSFMVKCRNMWHECKFPEEVCDEMLLDRIKFKVRHEECQCKLLSKGKDLKLEKKPWI